jgi:L-asparagine oxygenase
MTHSLKSVVAKHGYAFIGEYRLRASTVDVANEIGHTITPWEGGLIQELVPRATAPPNTYSGIYGIDRFPFHTDLAHWRLPPRYLLLRCLNG